jgi:hypothetical protein
MIKKTEETQKCEIKLRGFSPQANYTDRATAACLRSYRKILLIEDIAWSAQRISTPLISDFYTRSRYFSIKVAPQL